jgi:DNA-directed RNA polymerase subunit RPC12/RpoP
MATVTFCSGCGAALDLADLADNRCPKCGQTAEFRPAESVDGVVQKLCVICGADVAGQPRMKDKNGSYFCIPCGKADSNRKHSVGTPCKECGDKFPDEQLLLHNGEKVCEGCLNRRRERQRENSRKFRAQAYEDDRKHTIHVQIGAGVVMGIAGRLRAGCGCLKRAFDQAARSGTQFRPHRGNAISEVVDHERSGHRTA